MKQRILTVIFALALLVQVSNAWAVTVSQRISSGNDDVEERVSDGDMYRNSTDIEMSHDLYQNGLQIVGLRFRRLAIPQGVTINSAYIEFETDEVFSDPTNLVIVGQDTDSATPFGNNDGNVSSRTTTTASVNWSPAGWTSVNQIHQTADIASIVQEIVNRSGWSSGNNMVIMIEPGASCTDSGCRRTAESYEGNRREAPLLVVDYSVVPVLSLIAEWRFDELNWDADPIIDSTGSGFDGTALETVDGVTNIADGKVCRAGRFPDLVSNTSHAIATELDVNGDVGNSGAISIWYRSNSTWTDDTDKRTLWDASSDGRTDKYFYLTLLEGGRLQFGAEDSSDGDYRIVTAPQSVAAGQWVNIVVNWDVNGADQGEIWLDGNKLSTTTTNDSMRASNLGDTWTLYIGDNRSGYFAGGSNRSANGDIDEVLVYSNILDSATINSHIAYYDNGQNIDGSPRICPGASVDHYVVSDNGSGVSCEPYTVSVSAVDAGGITVDIPAGTQLTLSTDFANDGWTNPGGAGATYTLPFDAASVDFQLRQLTPATLEIDVDDTSGITDDDGDRDDDIVEFTDAGFIFYTDHADGDIGTQLSGKTSGTETGEPDIMIRAVKSNPLDLEVCEALISNATADIGIAYQCDNPGSCATSNNAMIINTTQVNASTETPYTQVSLSFDAEGKSAFTLNYADAGLISLLANADLAVSGGVGTAKVHGPSNSFLVKPAGICVQATESGNTCVSGDASCSIFRVAGIDFDLEVSGRAWADDNDADTDFCNNAVTRNFIHTAIGLRSNLVAPLSGVNAALSVATTATDASGIVAQPINVNEVGVFTFSVPPLDYFSVEIAASTSANVGRFIPAYFELSGGSVTAANTSTASFTYLGQAILMDYSLTAKSALVAATTTQNYGGSFAKLDLDNVGDDLTDVRPAPSGKDVAYGVVDTITPASYNARLVTAGPGAMTTWIDGVINVIALPLIIQRGLSPEGPATNVDIGLLVEDSDGVSLPLLNLDSAAAGGGATDTLALAPLPGNLFYGRAFIPPVYGPEIPLGTSLDIPLFVQYFNGSAFVTNPDDSSTAYGLWTASCADADVTDGLSCGETPVNVPAAIVIGGRGDPVSPITIARPGLNNTGSLNVTFAVDDWLKFDWDSASSGDEDPVSLITFGTYRGHDRIIYWRENHSP